MKYRYEVLERTQMIERGEVVGELIDVDVAGATLTYFVEPNTTTVTEVAIEFGEASYSMEPTPAVLEAMDRIETLTAAEFFAVALANPRILNWVV